MTCAYQLAKNKNIQVDVYEASDSVGGLSKTITLWNQKVDLGPHRFFSSDPRVNKVWLEAACKNYEMVNRLTRIFYKKKFYYYPIKPFDALFNLGVGESANCVLSYLKENMSPTPQDGTFENWVTHRFGKRLYEIFFKTYSEKLWGISCKNLDADFAAQRIKKLSLSEALKNAIQSGKGNQHKTLVDQFAYPTGGSGMIYERMAESIRKQNGNVFFQTPVHQVLTADNSVTGLVLEGDEYKEFDHVVSTMPLTLLVDRLPEAPKAVKENLRSLMYRNTILVYLNIDCEKLFPDNWLYVHSSDLHTGRITNFRNWCPSLYGNEKTSILTLEYWCYNHDEMWQMDNEALIKMATQEIRKTGLIRNDNNILDGFAYRIERSYPVYQRGYKNVLKPVEEYLNTVGGLSVIGRYGAFKYNNQDHSILMGLLAAENIISGTQHDLWEINTDYEYQEDSIITKTGLEKK